MQPDNVPHRLLLIGYWSHPTDSAEHSRGWPDPRDLAGAWSADNRLATLAHLRRGKVFRTFAGRSECRICGLDLGEQELTDGVWAWPQGLEHYIEKHDVRLPDTFVAAARLSEASIPSWLASLEVELWLQAGDASTPVNPTAERSWIVDDGTWLDWAVANTPARPTAEAASLDEVRQLCSRLSHRTWGCEIEEVMGRWLVRIQRIDLTDKFYAEICSAAVLERRLLSVRIPDPDRILDPERAAPMAIEYDGAWGGARLIAASPEVWAVWVRGANGAWPTQDQVHAFLNQELRFGWVCYHPNGDQSFITPPGDEIYWRWRLSHEREAGEQRLKYSPGKAESRSPVDVTVQDGASAGWWPRIRKLLFSR
jgi:hypothetical protein